MSARIGIGLTTYKDISGRETGERLFDAYSSVLPSLTPTQVKIWNERHAVSTRSEFGAHWLTLIPFEVREKKGGARLESGSYRIGPEWRRSGAGGGDVRFRPELQNDRDDHVLIDHKWTARAAWLSFFEELVSICEPSHAMLHLFTPAEIAASEGRFGVDKFDGAFAGEHNFTSWRSDLGHWYQPDRWKLEERRQYRYLPQLSWANFLGPEFSGRYDDAVLEAEAASFTKSNGILFTVTSRIDDVVRQPEEFKARRARLRAAFEPGFFRI